MMSYSSVNHRRVPRTLSHLPIQLSFGSQIMVQGQLRIFPQKCLCLYERQYLHAAS